MEDLVTISDDEGPTKQYPSTSYANQHKNQTQHSFGSDDTIVLEEATLSQKSDQNDNIIEVDNSEIARKQIISILMKEIKNKNELLAAFIEKCFELENSDGMFRIIHRTLIKYYKNADETYKTSEPFKRVLTKSLFCLETDSGHKFSHLKNLCDTLKFHEKKRDQHTTLASNLKDTHQSPLKRSGSLINRLFKTQRVDNIIIESDEESSVINLEDNQADNDVILLDDEQMDLDQPTHSNGENNHSRNDLDLQRHQSSEHVNGKNQSGNNLEIDQRFIITDDEKENQNFNENLDKESLMMPKIQTIEEDSSQTLDIQLPFATKNEDSLLMPKIQEVYHLEPSPREEIDTTDKQIEDILKQIEEQQVLIRIYDEQEVTTNSAFSPYLLSEKAKTKIVQLYKQLCELTGQKSIKQRKVRLQVLEGHPPGPTRKLEEFINSNIGKDGYPPFPDFFDVVKCVLDASKEDELGWNKPQVMKEASSLFSQCGRALQRRRQHREYRDLLSLAKKTELGTDDDPADEDPELLRKLEENRRLAHRKESEILERYTMMQYLPTQQPRPGSSLDPNIQNGRLQNGGNSTGDPNPSDDHQTDELSDTESADNDVDDSGNDFDREIQHENNVNSSKNIQETSTPHADDSGITTDVSHLENVKIKQEPVDISKMLDELGDDYTTTILDIEDPFLVIEISSDGDSSPPTRFEGDSDFNL